MLNIVKIGGNIIEDPDALHRFLTLFSKIKGPKILVHGGGKKASEVLSKLGIAPKMANGRRITDAASLEVVTMVYAGLVNKTIVAKLQAAHCNAIGMSGADANSIQAHKRSVVDIDYGFAGDIDGINAKQLVKMLQMDLTPVFCALTHDTHGQLLNTNADTIASALAIGLSSTFKVVLNYCFELDGVLSNFADKTSVIPKINCQLYATLVQDGTISAGMLPKLHNCFEALKAGVQEVRIGNMGLFEKENNNFTRLTL